MRGILSIATRRASRVLRWPDLWRWASRSICAHIRGKRCRALRGPGPGRKDAPDALEAAERSPPDATRFFPCDLPLLNVCLRTVEPIGWYCYSLRFGTLSDRTLSWVSMQCACVHKGLQNDSHGRDAAGLARAGQDVLSRDERVPAPRLGIPRGNKALHHRVSRRRVVQRGSAPGAQTGECTTSHPTPGFSRPKPPRAVARPPTGRPASRPVPRARPRRQVLRSQVRGRLRRSGRRPDGPYATGARAPTPRARAA